MAKLITAKGPEYDATTLKKRRHFRWALRNTETADELTDMDLDTEISLLLEQDKKVSAEVPDLDGIDLAPEFTVFDRERRSLEDALEDGKATQQQITTEDDDVSAKTRKKVKIAIALAGLCAVFGVGAIAMAFALPPVATVIQGETTLMPASSENALADTEPHTDAKSDVNSIILRQSPIIENFALQSGVIDQNGVSLTFALGEGPVNIADDTRFYLFNQKRPVSAKHGNKRDATATVSEAGGEKLLDVEFSRLIGEARTITLNIKGMTKRTELNMPLDTARLFDFATQGDAILELDDVNVIIEGMDYNRDNIVLVMHGEVMDTAARVPVVALADLKMTTMKGDEVTVTGYCQYNENGTDVRFMLPDISGLNMDPSSMSLTLNAVETTMPDINFIIHLEDEQ